MIFIIRTSFTRCEGRHYGCDEDGKLFVPSYQCPTIEIITKKDLIEDATR